MKRVFYNIICAVVLLNLSSCDRNTIYSHHQTLPANGWPSEEWVTYDVAISDTTALYDTFFYVRHHTNYPYQNLWLFVKKTEPNGTIVNDTLEFYLADQRGQWLGSGVSSLREMPLIYKTDQTYPDSGTYHIAIQHGMREELLKGIQDLGVKVVKKEN